MSDKEAVPDAVHDFLSELTPDDVGSHDIDGWTIRFEGFSGICMSDVEERIALPKSDPRAVDCLGDVLDEVEQEFREAAGDYLHTAGVIDGDEPIVYAVSSPGPAPQPS